MSKELRAAAVELGWSPEAVRSERGTIDEPSLEPVAKRDRVANQLPTRSRKPDTLDRLAEFGYIEEGTLLRPIARLFPRGRVSADARFRARVGKMPSRPVWMLTGESMRSLTALSKRLRDEHGIAFPTSSFNPCRYWVIEGEGPPERSLESIAQQLVL